MLPASDSGTGNRGRVQRSYAAQKDWIREGRCSQGSGLLSLRRLRKAIRCQGSHILQRVDRRLDRAYSAGCGNPQHGWRSPDPVGSLRGTSRWPKVRASKRSEEHTSELQSLMRISYAVFCLKNKKENKKDDH